MSVSLLNRIRNIVRANANDMLNRAEDPEKALEQMITDMSQDLVKVRQAAALAISAQERLQAEYDQRRQAVQEWQRRAELAVDKGDDELAKQALSRKLQYQHEADQLKTSLDAQSVHIDELRTNVQALDNRVQQAVLQRQQLVARYRTAEATRTLEEQTSNTGRLSTSMGELENRTVDAEAQAAAYHELSRDPLEERFTQLEAGPTVDDELATLKKQRLLSDGKPEK